MEGRVTSSYPLDEPEKSERSFVGYVRVERGSAKPVQARFTTTVLRGESLREVLRRDARAVLEQDCGGARATRVRYEVGSLVVGFDPMVDDPELLEELCSWVEVGADYPASAPEREAVSFCGDYAVTFRSGYVLRDNSVLYVPAGTSLREAARRDAKSWFDFGASNPATLVEYRFGGLVLRLEP